MSRFFQIAATVTLFLFSTGDTLGFSMLGPRPPWQTTAIGYDLNGALAGGGGPMNINEEYRWNVPEIHYGYSAEFLSYFGQRGVDSIEEAVQLFNDLPDLDNVDLNDYPTESGRVNLRAAALGITDVKTTALNALMAARGVADPTRYAFVLRNRWVVNTITNYLVTKRNFDPFTLRPSSFINGTLYTYIIEDPVTVAAGAGGGAGGAGGGGAGAQVAWANNFPVDPLERLFPRTLPVAGSETLGVPPGFFFTQLTRDDVGALKHIYRSSNYNTENALGDVTGGAGAGGVTTGFPGGGGVFDFPAGAVGAGGGPFDFPFAATNALAGGAVGGVGQAAGGAGVGGAAGGTFINPAIKGGFSQIEFVRADYDSLVGVFFNPLTVRFTETVLTNDRPRSQSLTRTVTQPDIIFDAADLQGGDAQAGDPPVGLQTSPATGWNNSDALDGITGDDFGPGVIVPPFRITFNAVGPVFLNAVSTNSAFLTEGSLSARSELIWGSFDGSTNAPVVYPVGTSILDVESQVRR